MGLVTVIVIMENRSLIGPSFGDILKDYEILANMAQLLKRFQWKTNSLFTYINISPTQNTLDHSLHFPVGVHICADSYSCP